MTVSSGPSGPTAHLGAGSLLLYKVRCGHPARFGTEHHIDPTRNGKCEKVLFEYSGVVSVATLWHRTNYSGQGILAKCKCGGWSEIHVNEREAA